MAEPDRQARHRRVVPCLLSSLGFGNSRRAIQQVHDRLSKRRDARSIARPSSAAPRREQRRAGNLRTRQPVSDCGHRSTKRSDRAPVGAEDRHADGVHSWMMQPSTSEYPRRRALRRLWPSSPYASDQIAREPALFFFGCSQRMSSVGGMRTARDVRAYAQRAQMPTSSERLRMGNAPISRATHTAAPPSTEA